METLRPQSVAVSPRAMGNVESGPEGTLGAVGSLKHRLQSLEETVRSIEVSSSTSCVYIYRYHVCYLELE